MAQRNHKKAIPKTSFWRKAKLVRKVKMGLIWLAVILLIVFLVLQVAIAITHLRQHVEH
ncbi:MAG: hypothetical protein ACO1N9_02410 [Flavobacterium sp.]|jgi:hypothetical protein|nr:hypothetical protein [Spirochaetales bacterium]